MALVLLYGCEGGLCVLLEGLWRQPTADTTARAHTLGLYKLALSPERTHFPS